MTKKEAYEWIDNNFFGDLTEEQMIENLKAMVDRIFKKCTGCDGSGYVHSSLNKKDLPCLVCNKEKRMEYE